MSKMLIAAMLSCCVASAVLANDSMPSAGSSPNSSNGNMSGSTSTTENRGSLNSADFKFAKNATAGGIGEVAMGKLAATNASSDAVKQFGQKMVDDHSKANAELAEILKSKNVVVPMEMSSKEVSMQDKLAKNQGADFDKHYINMMVKDHKKDVSEFKDASENAADPEIKAFAAKYLPVIQGHLEMAKDIQKNLSGDNTTTSNK